MPYYPKNKILTNQNAVNLDKSSFVYASDYSLYTGPYYKLYNGDTFTGRYPGDGENKKIIMISNLGGIEGKHNDFISVTENNSIPFESTPPLFPTKQDYEYGSFIRYFSKKRNEFLFKELTKDEYNTLNNNTNKDFEIYKPFYIKWMLTGNVTTVSDFNRYSILSTEEKEKVYGLNEFLKMNYTQYYKYPTQDNLYTSGKEFKTPNGEEYIGPYHTHPDKGPMVGATHSMESHSILIPINSQMSQPLTGSQMTFNTQMNINSSTSNNSY